MEFALSGANRLTLGSGSFSRETRDMQFNVSFLPAYGAAFILMFARIGTMVMLLPGVTMIFATDLHHLVIAGLHDSYRLFAPGEIPVVNDVTQLVIRTTADAFRIGVQLSGPFLVFGLVFNIALGVLSRLMPQMQVYFVAVPLSIMIGFLILLIVVGAMMASFLGYVGGVLHELAPYS